MWGCNRHSFGVAVGGLALQVIQSRPVFPDCLADAARHEVVAGGHAVVDVFHRRSLSESDHQKPQSPRAFGGQTPHGVCVSSNRRQLPGFLYDSPHAGLGDRVGALRPSLGGVVQSSPLSLGSAVVGQSPGNSPLLGRGQPSPVTGVFAVGAFQHSTACGSRHHADLQSPPGQPAGGVRAASIHPCLSSDPPKGMHRVYLLPSLGRLSVGPRRSSVIPIGSMATYPCRGQRWSVSAWGYPSPSIPVCQSLPVVGWSDLPNRVVAATGTRLDQSRMRCQSPFGKNFGLGLNRLV